MNKTSFRRCHWVSLLLASVCHATMAYAIDPAALPQGGQVVSGHAAITQSGAHMQVNQSTDRSIINWQNFNIGKNASVDFHQPSSASVTLNRVITGNASEIHGRLNANGQVFLVNPSGVLFGANAQVDTAGLVASTHNISNEDFLAGRQVFTRAGATGEVENHGTITVHNGGTVALIAPNVSNTGVIQAAQGNIALASGEKVLLDVGDNGYLQIEVDGSAISGLVQNSGLLQADGGQVVLSSQAASALVSSVVANSGEIRAQTLAERGGRILLLADMANGKVRVDGRVDASAPQGGDGGFVETSAAKVRVADSARITTKAAQGKTGSWLIDPDDYTIAATGGDTTGAALTANLATTNIMVETNASGGAGNGDILVNDAIAWNADTVLTLTADRNILVNENITATGNAAGLVMAYGRAGGGGDYALNDGANITLSGNAATLQMGQAGSLQNYTLIHNVTDLQNIDGNLAGRYALGNDIDASATSGWNGGQGFMPIGNGAAFTGQLHGLGHKVTSLTINLPTTDSVGMVGVASGAIFRDIGLTGGQVTGDRTVGMLVGELLDSGVILNSYAIGNVTGGIEIGGLAGVVEDSSVSASHADVVVHGSQYVGGLIGEVRDSTVSGSYATGNVTSTNRAAGGLAGRMVGATVDNSYATGAVDVANDSAGGLVGESGFSSVISNSYATGAVSGGDTIGGLAGDINLITITGSYATGTVTANGNDAGGLVGYAWDSSIGTSYAMGNVTSTGDSVGGLVGNMRWVGISDSYASGDVTGAVSVGGLIGYGSDSNISRSFSNGAVAGNNSFGGLIGNNSNLTINQSFWDTQTSGQAGSNGGVGLSTAQMQTLSTFSGAGWDVDAPGQASSVWIMVDGSTTPWLNGVAYIPLTITVTHDGFVYDATAYSGGNGYAFSFVPDMNYITGTASYGGTAQGATNAGTYTISLSGFYSSLYDITVVDGTLTISPRSITVKADDASKVQGSANPSFTFTVGGAGLATGETNADVFSGTLDSVATIASPAGNYAITQGTLAANSNYQVAFTNGALTVTPASNGGGGGGGIPSVPAETGSSELQLTLRNNIDGVRAASANNLNLLLAPDFIRLPAEQGDSE